MAIEVNYPTTKNDLASYFIATCLLPKRVSSLIVAPYVYAQIPYEVFKSYTDKTKVNVFCKIAIRCALHPKS